MFRKLAGVSVLALLFCVSAVWAEEVKGKLTKVDEANHKITISVDGKETEYTVAKDCKMPKRKGKDGTEKELTLSDLAKSMDRVKDKGGYAITAVTTKKDGKETVTEIKTGGSRPKKSDK
jgi:CRISPR/Cas system-associated exonuclease Cas4 (RecB family)